MEHIIQLCVFSYEIKIQDAKDYDKPKPPEVELPESQEQEIKTGVLVATLPQPGSHQVFMPKLLSGPESTVLGALMLQVIPTGPWASRSSLVHSWVNQRRWSTSSLLSLGFLKSI